MKKNILSFSVIESKDLTSIYLLDESYYFESPENPLVEIVFPRSDETYSYIINPNQITKLNTSNLGYNNCLIDLPDGIYKIRYSVAPNAKVYVCKEYFRTTKLKVKLAELLFKSSCDTSKGMSDEDVNNLYKIDLLLSAIDEAAGKDNDCALRMFKKASSMLDKLTSSSCLNSKS